MFVVALYMSFPYDRAKEAAIRMASKNLDVDVEIGSAGPAFGLAVMFQDIRVRTRPTTGKPTRFTIDSAKFSPSLFALFSSSFPFTLDGGRAGRQDRARLSRARPARRGAFRTELSARDIDLAEIPGVKEAINLPLTGKLKLEVELASETGRYADANGAITLTLRGRRRRRRQDAAQGGRQPVPVAAG